MLILMGESFSGVTGKCNAVETEEISRVTEMNDPIGGKFDGIRGRWQQQRAIG